MYKFYFEKLEVWQNARQFVKDIYKVTEAFPKEEQFGITNQYVTVNYLAKQNF